MANNLDHEQIQEVLGKQRNTPPPEPSAEEVQKDWKRLNSFLATGNRS
ncbi:MAG: hypothetical protein GY861_14350 [bacterium]|nr:hypothetical protein [bacterium]